jgi:hypothetical protein
MRLWQTEAGSLQEFPFRCRFQSQAPSSSPYWIIAEAKIDLSRRRFFQHEVMNILLYLAASCSVLAVVFAFLAFFTARWRRENKGLLAGEIAQLIRSESDRIRAESAEQGRRMRQELAENLRGFQTATLQAFTELGRQLGGQIREFGEKLEAGLRSIDERASGIDARLDGGWNGCRSVPRKVINHSRRQSAGGLMIQRQGPITLHEHCARKYHSA